MRKTVLSMHLGVVFTFFYSTVTPGISMSFEGNPGSFLHDLRASNWETTS